MENAFCTKVRNFSPWNLSDDSSYHSKLPLARLSGAYSVRGILIKMIPTYDCKVAAQILKRDKEDWDAKWDLAVLLAEIGETRKVNLLQCLTLLVF